MLDKTYEENAVEEEKVNRVNDGKDAVLSDADYEREEDSKNEQIIKIEDLINSETHDDTILKIRRLQEYGITEEMIVEAYKDLAGNVTSKEAAISNLSVVFDRFCAYISSLPNAIVIDPDTGYIDHEASIAKGYAVGIYSDHNELSYTVSDSEDHLKKLLEYVPSQVKEVIQSQVSFEGYKSFLEYQFMIENFDNATIKDHLQENIDSSLDKSVEEKNIPDKLMEASLTKREVIENSEYEKDPYLYEITSLQIAYHRATGTEKAGLGLKVNEFYAKHPEYIEKVDLYNSEGEFRIPTKFNNYKNAYKFEAIVHQLDRIANINLEDFEKLSNDEKKVITIALFNGYNYKEQKNSDYKLLAEVCEENIQKLFPNLNLENKRLKNNRIELAKIAKDILGIEIEGEEISFEAFKNFSKNQMDAATDNYLRNNKESYKSKSTVFDMQNANLNFSYDAAIKNYFSDSNVEMNDESKRRFEYLYKSYTVNSWLEEKDKAVRLRYMSIQSMKENYKRSPETEYTKGRIAQLEKEEKEFIEKHGEKLKEAYGEDFFDSENEDQNRRSKSTKIRKGLELEYKHYKNNLTLAGLTKFYTRDILNFQNGVTYDGMNNDDKKSYIRNTLAVYQMIKDEPDAVLSKMMLRRLELMNSEDKKFITFDEEGNPIINEDLLLEEYQSMSSHKWSSFDELVQMSEQKKEKYVLKKLGECAELEQGDFRKISSRQSAEKAFEKIEKIKMELNQKNREKQEREAAEKENQKQLSNGDLDSAIKDGRVPVEQMDTSAVKEAQEKAKKSETQTREETEDSTKEETADKSTDEGKTSVEDKKKSDEETIDKPNGSDADVKSLDELMNMDAQNQNGQLIDTRTLGFFGRVKQIFGRIRDFFFGKRTTKQVDGVNDVNTKKDIKKEMDKKLKEEKQGELDKKQKDLNVNQSQNQVEAKNNLNGNVDYLHQQFPIDHEAAKAGLNSDGSSKKVRPSQEQQIESDEGQDIG